MKETLPLAVAHFENYYNYLRYDSLPELFKASFKTNGELDRLNDKLKKQARELIMQTIGKDANKYKTEFTAIQAKYRILSLEDKLAKQMANYEIKKYPGILVKDGSAVEEAVKRIEKTTNRIQTLYDIINDATKKDKLYNISNSDLYQALEQEEGLLHEAYGAIVIQRKRLKGGKVIADGLKDMLDNSDLNKYNEEIAYFRINAYQSLKEKYGDEFASLAIKTFKFKIEESKTEVGKFIVTDLADSEKIIKQEIGSRIENLREDLDFLPKLKKEKHDLETIMEASIEDEEDRLIDDIKVYEQWFDNPFASR